MAQSEARQLIEDVDLLLEVDAEAPHARDRLSRLREELEYVEENGEWPGGAGGPWHHFAESNGA